MENLNLTPTLYRLIGESAAPLRSVETAFAVDSTGFGANRFYRHFSNKYGTERLRRDFMKLHAHHRHEDERGSRCRRDRLLRFRQPRLAAVRATAGGQRATVPDCGGE